MSLSQPPLAYFQASPVRGQLEPYDGQTRTGWRYLQCTDTPNELKVLLPPKTATLYSQLLQVETAELAKGKRASWDSILQVRHLKDRMIRKCQRISKSATPASAAGANPAFRLIHAPPDFRLKEMERWFKDQEQPRGRTKDGAKKYTVEAGNIRSQTPSCSVCGHLSTHGHTHAHSHAQTPSPRNSHVASSTNRNSLLSQRMTTRTSTAGVKRRTSASSSRSTSRSQSSSGSQRNVSRPPPAVAHSAFLSPVIEEHSGMSGMPLSPTYTNPYGLTPEVGVDHPTPRDVISPEPLPHPYRSSTNLSADPLEMPQPMMMPEATILTEEPIPIPAPGVPGSDFGSIAPSLPPKDDFAAHYAEFQDGLAAAAAAAIAGPSSRPGIPRRRSSLKQSGTPNNGRSTKVVSWAMDNDWSNHMSKFDHIAYATEIAGHALDDARNKFQEEIAGVQNLRRAVTDAIERLRLETEKLQLDDQALRTHEERLNLSFQQLQEKEINYKETVSAVLEETKRMVMTADRKRDELLTSLNSAPH